MAKIGLEVEGKYAGLGLLTFFCSAEEFFHMEDIFGKLQDYGVDQIYISDHLNEIDLYELGEMFDGVDVIVTVELTQLNALPPENVEIYWNASQASYAQARTIKFLRPMDQIKIENEKTVFSWIIGNADITLPEDFEGDREV
jgi:hypothetical protein